MLYALYRVVVRVCKPHVKARAAEALWIYAVAVVLARNVREVVAQVDARLVLPPVAEFQLVSIGTACQGQYLVAKADAKRGRRRLYQFCSRLYRRHADLGVARPVADDDPLGLERHHLVVSRVPRQSHDAVAGAHYVAYDAVFHSGVEDCNAVPVLVAILFWLGS